MAGFLDWTYKTLRGCGFFVSHGIYAVVAIGMIEGLRWLIGHSLENDLFFDILPVRYIFDLMDLVVLLIIVAWAVSDGIKAMRDDDHGRHR
jgi:hypothetical protein